MKAIRITSKKDGFRRAGITHTGTATYPINRFSPDQMKALKAEPMLVVDEVDVPDPKPEEGKGPAKK